MSTPGFLTANSSVKLGWNSVGRGECTLMRLGQVIRNSSEGRRGVNDCWPRWRSGAGTVQRRGEGLFKTGMEVASLLLLHDLVLTLASSKC